MDDFLLRSRELLQESEDLEQKLQDEYATHGRPHIIGDLQGRLGRCLKRADICASLAVAQRIDVRVLGR